MKISIITATFNSAATVRDTLESILRQTHQDWELIIEDGLSKDETLSIAKEYEPRCKGRLRIFSEKDNGLYDAMNRGIARATGDVIGILNSDDFFTSDEILSVISNELSDKDIDAIYGDVIYVERTNKRRKVRHYCSKIFQPFLMKFGFMPAHPSFYCRRIMYERYGTYDTSFRVAGDFELLLRMIYFGHIRMRYIQKNFVTMRQGGISSSGWKSHQIIMDEHVRALKKNGLSSHKLLLSLRYIYKVIEILMFKFKLFVSCSSLH